MLKICLLNIIYQTYAAPHPRVLDHHQEGHPYVTGWYLPRKRIWHRIMLPETPDQGLYSIYCLASLANERLFSIIETLLNHRQKYMCVNILSCFLSWIEALRTHLKFDNDRKVNFFVIIHRFKHFKSNGFLVEIISRLLNIGSVYAQHPENDLLLSKKLNKWSIYGLLDQLVAYLNLTFSIMVRHHAPKITAKS